MVLWPRSIGCPYRRPKPSASHSRRKPRRLDWSTPWHTAHTFEQARQVPQGQDTQDTQDTVPKIEWFSGTLNVAYNCVDRHVEAGLGAKVALHFEGEQGDRRTVTYAALQLEVGRAANALLDLGIGRRDRVVIYLPVIVETVIITLACARIGAVHSLVFGGFSAEALKFRVEDTGAKLLVTTDGQFRRGHAVPVKENAGHAVSGITQSSMRSWSTGPRPLTGWAPLPGRRAGISGGTTP